MNAATEGTDAIATTRVLIRAENSRVSTHALTGEAIHRTFTGTGAGMDIVVSSVKAYIGALNKMLGTKSAKRVCRTNFSFCLGAYLMSGLVSPVALLLEAML